MKPDPDQLSLLKRGVREWNLLRRDNQLQRPNLEAADLKGARLAGVDLMLAHLNSVHLEGADLEEANLAAADLNNAFLSKADLKGAELSHAHLSYADLSNADLRGANLSYTNLHGADLRGADLSNANLSWAELRETALNGAKLNGAMFVKAIFADVDLSEVKGLEDASYFGPVTIGLDTIYKSRGKIPEVFLRGCGVPEELISYIDSLTVGKAIQFYSAFISYSSSDELFAKRLHADLQANRIRIWFAPEDLKIGDKFRAAIDEAIRIYDKLIVVLSGTSVASDWVEKEVEAAFEKERREKRVVLFPIRIDEAVMETKQAWAADIRRTRHIGDFTAWTNPFIYQNQINRLLRDLRADELKP